MVPPFLGFTWRTARQDYRWKISLEDNLLFTNKLWRYASAQETRHNDGNLTNNTIDRTILFSSEAHTHVPKVTREYADRRRAQILQAALACAARKGFHQTSMRDISREAGLSFGALYNYFNSKEDILAALVRQRRGAKDTLFRQLERCKTAQEAIRRLFELMFSAYKDRSFRAYGAVDLESFCEALRNPQVGEIAREEIDALAVPLAFLIRRWQAVKQIREDLNAEDLAHYLISRYTKG